MERLNARISGFGVVALAVIAVAVVPVGAQEAESAQDSSAVATEEDRDVFAPFVSRLRVAVRDPQVRLTWRDAADLTDGRYRIYRHTSEINQSTLNQAELVSIVEPGVETYLDTPLQEGEYYYAVIASSIDGRLYPIFVPFRNVTLTPVTVAQLETEEDLAASIYDIAAIVQENAVAVRFDASRNGRDLVVYRSTIPFEELPALTDATLITSIESSTRRLVDYPVPGVDYFYGVFDRALLESGSITIDRGENVLAEPIRISLNSAEDVEVVVPAASKRRAPLPILQFDGGLLTTSTSVRAVVPFGGQAQTVSTATESAIGRLLARSPRPAPFDPEPVVLAEDRDPATEGAPRTLSQIVTGPFTSGSYAEAASLLRNLLQVPLSTDIERRVRFYLGQSLYLDGRSEPAFVELLLAAEGSLYPAVRPWLDGILGGSS